MASKTVADFAVRTAIGPFGSRMKSDAYTESGVPVIRGTNLTGGKVLSGDWVYVSEKTANDLSSCCVYPGDLVFPHRGAIGEIGIVPDQFPRYVMSSSLMTLSCDRSKAHPEYIYYFFKSATGRHELLKNASQVGTPGIGQPLSTLRAIEVPLPSPNSQRLIAKILGDLDSKIDLNRRINQTLEAMAQAIFKSWFVDFDPVKAKIAAARQGRAPLRAAMSAISGKPDAELDALPREHYDQLAATAALFPEEMGESELGEIPRGWEVADFGAVSTCFDKRRIPLSSREREKKKGSIPYYGATSVMDHVDEAIFDDVYLLLGEDGSVLKPDGTPFVQYIWGKSWVNNHAHVLQGANGVSTEQLMLFISMQNISAYVTGAVQLKLNQKNMNSIPFVKADNEVNSRFSEVIAPLFVQHRSLAEEMRSLIELRDTLLPKLLSGELSVSPASEVATA